MPMGAKGRSAFQIPDSVRKPVLWVFLLALLLRVIVCFTSHTINPDGKHYIYQAQAVYQMDFSAITECRLQFVTIQPFLIALCFPITGDWVAAGLTVSVVFSMASLVCIYLLSRRFFEEYMSCLILLVYAMIPMFVKRSAEILRDPIFWFLVTFGMLVFLQAVDKKKVWFDGFLSLTSCILFILATSLRLEGVALIAGSGLFLLFSKHETKKRQILFYCLPFGLLCSVLVVAVFLSDYNVVPLFKLDRFSKAAAGLIDRYDSIDQAVHLLIAQSEGIERRFLRRLGEVLWIVPVGSIINRIGEGFFYPYLLIFVIGCSGIRKRLSDHANLRYFIWLICISLIIVYFYMLYSWFISTRFLSIFLLASFIIIGFGLDIIIRFLHEGRKVSKSVVVAGLVIYIVGWGVGRNVRPYYVERTAFRHAGEIIERQMESNTVEKIVATRSKAASYAFFYAHRHVARPACIESEVIPVPSSYDGIIELMSQQGIRFFLYEAKYWPHAQYDFLSSSYADDFDVLGQWESKANGLIILFKLKTVSS